MNKPANGVKPKRRECKLRSRIDWPRALKQKRLETRAVCTGFLRNAVHLSNFLNLIKKHCEFHFHFRLKYYWRVTSLWGSVLKKDTSVSSEKLIGVELYNIASQKTVFFIFTAKSNSGRHLSTCSSPDVGDQLSYRRGGVVVDGPACVTQQRCWENKNMKTSIK